MKKFSILALLIILLAMPSNSNAQVKSGVVVYYDTFNRIVIATNLGYSYGNVLGYAFVESGYNVVGNLESLGSQEIYCPFTNSTFTVFVENCYASRQEAQNWINRGY